MISLRKEKKNTERKPSLAWLGSMLRVIVRLK